jgi:type III secretion system-like peptide-binding chaperone
VVTQSWRLATRIVRRHPELWLIETHPGGDQYDCLTLARLEPKARIHINRNGSIHAEGPHDGTSMPQEAMFGSESEITDLVAQLERTTGLGSPRRTPESTPAVLTFRSIEQIMTLTVNDRHSWDVRSVFLDTSGGMGPAINNGYLEPFPIAAERAGRRRPDDLFGVPYYRFWAVLRDLQPVAIADTDGNVYVGDEVKSLPELYRAHARRLTPVVAAAFAPILP